MFDGILLVNKPRGMTSRRAVDVVGRLVQPTKVGHAGTLDPLAEGLLVLCLGSATRLIEFVQQMPKCYDAQFRLGCSSPTEDLEGEVTEIPAAPIPSADELAAVLPRFRGPIEQRPSSYSALKIGGRRACDLLRAGRTVELPPRPVTIYQLEVVEYRYPDLRLLVECSRGTYVRALGRDVAAALGTAAVMTALKRLRIGGFAIEAACDPTDLSRAKIAARIRPSREAVAHLPQWIADDISVTRLRQGQTVRCPAELIASLCTTGRQGRQPTGAAAPGQEPVPAGRWESCSENNEESGVIAAGEGPAGIAPLAHGKSDALIVAVIDRHGRLASLAVLQLPDRLVPLRNFPLAGGQGGVS